MVDVPVVQYVDGGEGMIAYQVVGEHPIDLVHLGGWAQTVEGIWDLPMADRFYRRLASFARVVLVDRRGTGLSDPLRSGYVGGDFGPWIEEAASDFLTVLDTIGSERTVLLSDHWGVSVAISLAATHPDRVSRLMLVDPVVRALWAEDYPWGLTPELRQQYAEVARIAWGEGQGSGMTPAYRGPALVPSFRHDPAAHRWLARYERAGVTRGRMADWWAKWEFDVRPLLPLVQAPTLVMVHADNILASEGAAAYVASAIPGAEGPVPIPCRDLFLWAGQPPMFADTIEQFVTGSTGDQASASDRAFAVVLYTDVVGSTDHAARMGDTRWRGILEAHNHAAARQIERHRGRLVKHTGDGVLAVFDGPGRAVVCAKAILADIRQLDIHARAGLHAGEIELLGDDIAGIAVHIASRILDTATADEIIVSRTIKDLVVGSGLEFEDRGAQTLKGVPDEWQLFAVVN